MNETLRNFLVEELPALAARLGEDDVLLEPGVLDSVALVRLVGYLEEREGIVIEQEEIVPENFRTARAIGEFLARKKAAVGA